MTLARIYAEYIAQGKKQKERDPKRLFCTDIGKCPRQAAYRMLETEKNYQSPEAIDNKNIMFELADHIEDVLWLALREKDPRAVYQRNVDIGRDNWGGRSDIIADYNGRRVIEVKTVRSNAMSNELPKRPHVYQATVYHGSLKDEEELEAPPLLVYFDRGGSNPPQEYVLDDWEARAMEVVVLIDELEDVRYNLPELPDKLDKVITERSYGKTLMHEPPWECNYCDYSDTCKPNMSKSCWAERGYDDVWTVKKAADRVKLEQWATKNAHDILRSGNGW